MTAFPCKTSENLKVSVTTEPAQSITATYLATMFCPDANYRSWGVVLSTNHKRPMEGPHLLPEAVHWLPNELRRNAEKALSNEMVTISHSLTKTWDKFASLTPTTALQLAEDIEKVAAIAPPQNED